MLVPKHKSTAASILNSAIAGLRLLSNSAWLFSLYQWRYWTVLRCLTMFTREIASKWRFYLFVHTYNIYRENQNLAGFPLYWQSSTSWFSDDVCRLFSDVSFIGGLPQYNSLAICGKTVFVCLGFSVANWKAFLRALNAFLPCFPRCPDLSRFMVTA